VEILGQPRGAADPLLLVLLVTKALVVVALERKQLLKVGLAVVDALERSVVAQAEDLVALAAAEARFVVCVTAMKKKHYYLVVHSTIAVHSPFGADQVHGVYGLGAGKAGNRLDLESLFLNFFF